MDSKWWWILGTIGAAVGGYLIYTTIDPLVRLTGPMGTSIYKRRSQVTPQEIQFQQQVDSGQVRT